MCRPSRLLVVLVIAAAILPPARARAQAPAAAPDPLPGLPRPPDEPQSLHQAASPAPPYRCDPLPGPYFERDSRLDPPCLPPPGWFTDVEVNIGVPHVKNHLTDTVQVPGAAMPDTVHLPAAALDWTAYPRFELGYRLPTGFGEFALAYRFLVTSGSDTIRGPDASAALRSRLDINLADVDYASREFSLWPRGIMKWRFGVRVADVFFDSQADEPFGAAAAGSHIFETHTSNSFVGVGPHAGLELGQRWGDSGLALVGRVDWATLVGQLRQHFLESSTATGPAGTGEANPQDVPMITADLGLTWQPPSYPNAHVFVGYQYEYWWNVGRLSTTTSRGELSDQGILVRAELNF